MACALEDNIYNIVMNCVSILKGPDEMGFYGLFVEV